MSATISASVKFCPETRTGPLSVVALEPPSVAVVVLLLLELPQAVRIAAPAPAAITPARRRRVCIGSHLLCPAPDDARVRCPRSWQGVDAHHVPTASAGDRK